MASEKIYGFFRIDDGGASYWLHAWDEADAKGLLISCLTKEIGESIDDIEPDTWKITPMTFDEASKVPVTESDKVVTNMLAIANGRGVLGCSEWD